MPNYTDHAIRYHRAGLRVIPVWMDEAGKVSFPAWKKYETTEQTEGEILSLFDTDAWGIAIVCTPDLEVIDIDLKHDPFKTIHKQFFDEVFWSSGDETILPACTTVKTRSGGFHLMYRTDKAQGNQKLAIRKGSPEAVIETRGPGGLIFAAPTPGYQVMRNSYEHIGKLTDKQRDHLIRTARQLSDIQTVEPPKRMQTEYKQPEGDTPWDEYNARTKVADLLENYGWKELTRQEKSQYRYFNRPGAKNPDGIDGFVVKGENVFSPFSTSTEFEAGRGYTPFAVRAVMDFGGDFSACARKLMQEGYGPSQEEKAQQRQAEQAREEKAHLSDLMAFVRGTRFSIHDPIREEDATLTLERDGKIYKVGGVGMVGGIVGPQKSGKSLITSCTVAAGLSGSRRLGLGLETTGKRKIFFDTEQSKFFYQKTQERIYQLAGLRDDMPTYEAYHLRRLSKQDRVAAIEQVLAMPGDIELIVIDGLVDLCENFNDEKASQAAVDMLLKWSDVTGAMLLTVLHTTKTSGFLRGHLGSILQEKYDFGIKVSYDKERNEYNVKCQDARFAPFPSFDFYRDEKGFPYLDEADQFHAEEDEEEPTAAAYDPAVMGRANADDEIPF